MNASPHLKHIEEELKELRTEVKRLRKAVEPVELEVIEVSDETAEKVVREYITLMKKLGKTFIEDSEIEDKLNLPIEQVSRVFNKLLKEGVIRERKHI